MTDVYSIDIDDRIYDEYHPDTAVLSLHSTEEAAIMAVAKYRTDYLARHGSLDTVSYMIQVWVLDEVSDQC